MNFNIFHHICSHFAIDNLHASKRLRNAHRYYTRSVTTHLKINYKCFYFISLYITSKVNMVHIFANACFGNIQGIKLTAHEQTKQ